MTMRRRATPPAVIDDLVARLAALPELDGALVEYGGPMEIPAQQTRCYVYDPTDGIARTPLTQQGARTESYVLPVFLQLHVIGRDNRAQARDGWYDILEAIEADLFDAPEIGSVADDAEVEEIPTVGTQPGGNQDWVSRGFINVRVTATI